jgi:hypothetical protein
MEPNILPRAAEHFVNELPPRYRDWLDLYDSVEEQNRSLKEDLQLVERIDADAFYTAYHKMPAQLDIDRRIAVTYKIEWDFILARVAELLLPARLTKRDIYGLRMKAQAAQSYDDYTAYMLNVSNLLEPLWKVALNK